ncbi:hypothetical protein FOZ62_020897, partial [Perkinsus olseni]
GNTSVGSGFSLLSWHKSDAALIANCSDDIFHPKDKIVSDDLQQYSVTSPRKFSGVSFPVRSDRTYRLAHADVTFDGMRSNVEALIDDLDGRPLEIENAPGYELFISRCVADDHLDCSNQHFKFEVGWPMSACNQSSWDSSRLIGTLDDSEKALLSRETELYCANG